MKKLKALSIVLVLTSGLTLSSCLKSDSSDDYNKKWAEWVNTVNTQIKASVGSYHGYLYSRADESTSTVEKLDSIPITWDVINDSTMAMRKVPAALLVKQLPEAMKSLKTAISNADDANIMVSMAYDYTYHSPLMIYVYPDPVKMNVDYEGATHEVEVTFRYTETYTSTYAQYMQQDNGVPVNKSFVKLYPESVYLDGKHQYSLPAEAYLIWYGNK